MRSQFLILAVFLGAWLLSLFLSYRLKKAQRETPQEVDPQAPPVRPRESTRPPRVMASHVSSLPVVAPVVVTHQPALTRLGSPQEVRRGMVLMTILGPCRALEPPES